MRYIAVAAAVVAVVGVEVVDLGPGASLGRDDEVRDLVDRLVLLLIELRQGLRRDLTDKVSASGKKGWLAETDKA